jgi:hypothetical protein
MRHKWQPLLQIDGDGAGGAGGGGGGAGGAGAGGDGKGGDGAGGDGKGGSKEKTLLELGDGDAGAGDGKGVGGDGKGGDGAGGGAQPYFPDGIEEGLKGASDKETIDKLHARAKGLREQLSKKGGAAPEKPEGYDFAEIAKQFGDAADEKNPVNAPVFQLLRQVFHKRGLGQEMAAGIAGDVLAAMKEGGMLEAADPAGAVKVSAEKELGVMAQMFGGRDKALKIVRDERTYLQNLENRKIIDAEDHAELLVAMGTAQGLRAFQKLRAHFTGHELPQLEQSAQTAETLDSIRKRWSDPRFNTDAAFRAESERMLSEAQAGRKRA